MEPEPVAPAAGAPPIDPPSSSDDSDNDSGGEGGRVERLAAMLYQWTCVNCTRHNPVSPATEPMLAFAHAVDARLAAVREQRLQRALRRAARARAYADELAAWRQRAAAAAAGGGVSPVARVAGGTYAEFSAVVDAVDGAGGHMHASVVSVSATAGGERSGGGGWGVRDALASMARVIGLTPAEPSPEAVRAAWDGTGEPPPAPPTEDGADDDDAAEEAALPGVPLPPAVPLELLAQQYCGDCEASYCAHTAAPAATGEVALPLPLTDAEGAPRASSAAPAVVCNPGLLALTLQDDAPAEYLAGLGITPDVVARVLRSGAGACACAGGGGALHRHDGESGGSSGGGAGGNSDLPPPPPPPPSLYRQRQEAHPLRSAFVSGSGGFAPVTAVVYDDRMLLHEEGARPADKADAGGEGGGLSLMVPGVELPPRPPSLHPERPDRLRAIAQHLVACGLFQRCMRVEARPVADHELATVHEGGYINSLTDLDEQVAAAGGDLHFGSDTFANPHTLTAARLACGGVVAATQAVMTGVADRAIALVRPPGHHAEPDAAMGFCLYNNVAVAAAVAIKSLGARRVLIVDWDVHHGNGTQHMFESDPAVLYVSLHRHDRGRFFPGTGAVTEVGTGAGAGYTVNVPWDGPGMGDAEYALAFDELVMPVAHAFAPDIVLVSAGFDAARGDPLGGCDLTPAGYAHLTHRLLALAGGRVVVALEGGYNLTSISRGMEAVTRVLMGQAPPPLVALPLGAGDRGMPAGEGARDEAVFVGTPREQPPPRGDVFEPTRVQAAALEAACEDMNRDDTLEAVAPAASAARTVVNALRVHMRYWPALRAKWRAMERVAADAAEAKERRKAAVDAAAAAAATENGVDGVVFTYVSSAAGAGSGEEGEGEDGDEAGDDDEDDADDDDENDENDEDEDGDEEDEEEGSGDDDGAQASDDADEGAAEVAAAEGGGPAVVGAGGLAGKRAVAEGEVEGEGGDAEGVEADEGEHADGGGAAKRARLD